MGQWITLKHRFFRDGMVVGGEGHLLNMKYKGSQKILFGLGSDLPPVIGPP